MRSVSFVTVPHSVTHSETQYLTVTQSNSQWHSTTQWRTVTHSTSHWITEYLTVTHIDTRTVPRRDTVPHSDTVTHSTSQWNTEYLTAQQVRDQSIAKWQIQWNHITKRLTTKQFLPIIKDRLTTKIKWTPNFTAIVTARGNTKAYLHRFKIIEYPEYPYDGGTKLWITYYTTVPKYGGRERNL
jgi:hypothetical protein